MENIMSAEWTPNMQHPYRVGPSLNVYDDGYLRIEHDNYYISCGGKRISLSCKEFLIISRLGRSPERTVPSEEIWHYAWGDGAIYNAQSLRVYIHHLRSILAPFGLRIECLIKVGYRLSIEGHEG